MSHFNRFKEAGRRALVGASLLPLAVSIFSPVRAQAQVAPAPNLVSACSGVSLPRSVVTDILAPVAGGIVAPVQDRLNPVLGALGALLPLVPPLNIDVAGLLADAAAGQPVTLRALALDGTVVGPADQCDAQADSFTLRNPRGIAIGGNRITGLGSTGLEASAGEIGSIAFGNAATTSAGATNAVAIGTGASVTAGNSVALGAGSEASRGPRLAYAALGLVDAQDSVGEVSVGAAGQARQITHVAAGSAATDAANVGQLAGVAAQVAAVEDRAVVYDGPARDRVTLAGAQGTVIGNVAAGEVSATSREAVNGSQLNATNIAVTNTSTAITNLTNNISNGAIGPLRYSNAATPTLPNGGTPSNHVTLVGGAAGAVGLHNVADGTVAAGSNDAVNGGQLFALRSEVAQAASNAVQYDADDKSSVTLGGAGGTVVTNVRAGAVNAGSTDAVNGAQLNATNVAVANNSTAITNLTTSVTNNSTAITNLTEDVANGAIGPVRYSDAGDPTVPNGGTPTNDLTLVGASAGAVGLHNVADGRIAAGSTDAVNGGQIHALGQVAANAVSYDTGPDGMRTNRVTLAGGDPAAPVGIANVADGALSAQSTEAVNGSQLHATNEAVATAQSTAGAALALSLNSVQYDDGRSSVTLSAGGAPVTIRNIAAGVEPDDAVNVMQLNSGVNGAIAQANAYTDSRIAALNFNLREVRRDAFAGTASALAAAGLPQAYGTGRGMIAMSGGTYMGASAFAFGFSKAFNDGHTVVKMGGTYDSQGRAGASGGIGYQF